LRHRLTFGCGVPKKATGSRNSNPNRPSARSSIVIDLGMSKPSDLIQGTLDLLILRTLTLESMHGWAIARRIQLAASQP